MKQLITTAFLILAIQVFAQSDEIDKICSEMDTKVAEAMENEDAFEIFPRIKVTCGLMKRAIGPVDHLITIYFDEHEIEIGQPGQDVFHKEAVIRKAEFTISSVSYTIKYSYYFNEGGLLIKHVKEETGYECYISEYYFEDKQVIRMKQKPTSDENCLAEQSAEEFDITDPDKSLKAEASWLLEDADKFRQILFANYELFKN